MEAYNQFIQKLKNIFTDSATIKILNKYYNDDDTIKKDNSGTNIVYDAKKF